MNFKVNHAKSTIFVEETLGLQEINQDCFNQLADYLIKAFLEALKDKTCKLRLGKNKEVFLVLLV